MASRHNLHDQLVEILGSNNVYYQPPASVRMNYPAIRYSLEKRDAKKADNKVYTTSKKYTIVVIDVDPDSEIPDRLLMNLPMCNHTSRYISDNLYHDVFTVSY